MDSISEARLSLVMPALAVKVRQMATQLELEGLHIRVAQGVRSWTEQDTLWAKGRDDMSDIACKHSGVPRKPGTCPIHPLGATVTNARGGMSWHNFGAAVDCDPIERDGTIDWNPAHPQWIRMEKLGLSIGLTSGAYWKRLVDAPHFQLTGRFPENAPTDEVRQLFRDGGAQAIWAEIASS